MRTPNPSADQRAEIVVAAIEKNSREQLRIALAEFNGHALVQLRTWYRDGDDWKPGKGASFKVALLPAVVDGINRALERARADGLV